MSDQARRSRLEPPWSKTAWYRIGMIVGLIFGVLLTLSWPGQL